MTYGVKRNSLIVDVLFDGRPVLAVPTPRRQILRGHIDMAGRTIREEEKYRSAKQIKAKIARGEDRTNWVRASAMMSRKLERSIRSNPDDVHTEPD
jgi:hypothetical protein